MPEGSTPNTEQPRPKEIFSTANKKVSLEARLILGGEALSPKKTDLAKVTPKQLSEVKPETISIINNASTGERSDYWKTKGGNFDQHLQSWTTSLVGYMNDESFTTKEALAIYERYFSGEKTASNINLFVSDRLNEYTKDGKIDFDGLNQDMPAIKKLANIFGGNSSELVESLIFVKAKLSDLTKKQELINQVNEEKTVDQSPILRLNWLNPEEERLLIWLNQPAPAKTPAAPQPQPSEAGEKKYYWKYEKLSNDVRTFPKRLTYTFIANVLRNRRPDLSNQYKDEQLVQFVKDELYQAQAKLDQLGITQKELHNLSLGFINEQVLSHYRRFIGEEYGINLPSPEQITILPTTGEIAKAFNPKGTGLAHVNAWFPFIFLDVNVIYNHAQRLGQHEWMKLGPSQKGKYVRRLLKEIIPHEYTHLMGDISFWELIMKEGGQDEEIYSFVGKLGLNVAKGKISQVPTGDTHIRTDIERGRGLMEAVTVELTNQWAESMNRRERQQLLGRAQLDIPAYPGEREVLYALQNILTQEYNMTADEAFKKFVEAYFTPNGFRHLTELINGHRKTADGNFETKRPYFMSEIYALMEYEHIRKHQSNKQERYPLTLNFILKKLTPEQKQQIKSNLDGLGLAPKIKEHLSLSLV